MTTTPECKNIRISDEALLSVMEVSNESRRNLTGATEFLILKGFEVYKEELQLIKTNKVGNQERLLQKKINE